MRRLALGTAVLLGAGTPTVLGLTHGRGLPRIAGTADGLSAARCQECHEAEHAAWSASRHAHATTNANFAAAVVHSPLAGWCRDCHAPLRDRGLDDEGVNCAVCHVRDGTVLGTAPFDPAGIAAHRLRDTPALQDQLCAGCHEFTGPGGGDALQSTWTEWQASGSEQSCASCHLDGHRFRGAHDLQLLQDAVQIEPIAQGVRLQVAPELGHRLPTGDPFRRLELSLCADDACEQVVSRRWFWREYTGSGDAWQLTTDHTLGPGDTVVLRHERARAWRLTYWLADPTLALVRSERIVVVAQGNTVL